MNNTPINAVDCSPVLMAGWRAEIGDQGSNAIRALSQTGLSFGIAARRAEKAGAVPFASVQAVSAQAGFSYIREAQMKKARRIRQAFIKFGCGGRI